MGDAECHENEAPFPEALAAFFVQAYCPLAGTVLDPFSGSGTTVCEAVRFGRNGTQGQTTTKTFSDVAAARQHADKLIRQKTGKGYVAVA